MAKAPPIAVDAVVVQNARPGVERRKATRAVAFANWLQTNARRAQNSAAQARIYSVESRERLERLARRNTYHKILLTLAKAAVEPRDRRALLTEVLDAAITLTKADMGNIQL